jgi:hypothetical protein
MAKESLLAAEEKSLIDVATAAMEVRDLVNTPLQILEVSINLLGKEIGAEHSVLQRMNKAIANISEINATLIRYDSDLYWIKNGTPGSIGSGNFPANKSE